MCRMVILALALLLPSLTVTPRAPAWADVTASPSIQTHAPGFAADFLIARAAERRGDWVLAAQGYGQLAATEADNQDFLLRQSILLLNGGAFEQALETARQLDARPDSPHLARLMVFVDAARRQDLTAADAALSRISDDGLGQYIKPFFAAWLMQANGNQAHAYRLLEKLQSNSSLKPLAHFHIALMAEQAGDLARARTNYAQLLLRNPTYRALTLTNAFFLRHGLTDRHTALLRAARQGGLDLTELDQLSAHTGQETSLQVSSLREGAAEIMFDIAMLLRGEGANDVALPYLRLVLALRPDFAQANLALNDLLVRFGQYDQAQQGYAALAGASDVARQARLRLVELQRQTGQLTAARTALGQMMSEAQNWSAARQQMGELEVQSGNLDAAVEAFSAGLDVLTADPPSALQSDLLFARAQTYHQLSQFDAAVLDLQAALKANPNDPALLNYLGYLWAERGERLPEAEQLVSLALQQRGDDPFIMDSMGWVYYRQGQLDKAVYWLEKASELKAYDPVINDHLGDVYWAQGRQMEARYQWQRALLYRGEEKQPLISIEELRQKIATGPLFQQLSADRH